MFEDNIEFFEGKYQVALPWIDGHPPLVTNKDIALRRLDGVINRIANSPLYEMYDKVFQQWEEDEIIEEVEDRHTDREHVVRIMAKGNFDLRGWVKTGDMENIKVPGIPWNVATDDLSCQVEIR